MEISEFRKRGHALIDWMADYYENIEQYPVKSNVRPGFVKEQVGQAPEEGQPFEQIMRDFETMIMPGMTHWQSPNFFAYFPASSSPPSVLGEMLTATLGAQCMMWETSPAAAELEEVVMDWLKQAMKLPEGWSGVIQDTASTAALVAVISARQRISDSNTHGIAQTFRIYCSEQAHSSIDKAVMMSGIGSENLVKIPVDDHYAMVTSRLQEAIETDLEAGLTPLMIVGALGTTGTTAIDPIDDISALAQTYNCWMHVDAAYAGTALLLQEFRSRFGTFSDVDSLVFNPHKWMLTNFDCTAYFVKDRDALVNAFTLTPSYLRTRDEDSVNNYKDWGIQLGRRFRALKLWIVIRSYGLEGLRSSVRSHIEMGRWFATQVADHDEFELLAPVPLNTVCFRYVPKGVSEGEVNDINERLMHTINDSGAMYFTHTVLDGMFVLRFVPGSPWVRKSHVENAWKTIQNTASGLR